MPSPNPVTSFNNNNNNNLSDKNISNNNNSNYACEHNNESTKQKELPIIREEKSSKSDINTSKQPKKTKKSKAKKSDVKDKKYLSLPSTPHQAALISALNPALTQLAKSASMATTPTKPTIERFKNKSKILDSNLRKFINCNSSSTPSIKEGNNIGTLEPFDVLNEVEIKNKKSKRKNKKDGKLINKERKVRILYAFLPRSQLLDHKLPD